MEAEGESRVRTVERVLMRDLALRAAARPASHAPSVTDMAKHVVAELDAHKQEPERPEIPLWTVVAFAIAVLICAAVIITSMTVV